MVCADGRWWFHFKTTILDTSKLGNLTLFVQRQLVHAIYHTTFNRPREQTETDIVTKRQRNLTKNALRVNSHWVKANTKAM